MTYRNSLIIAVLGIPGVLLGGALVEIPRFGRKGALALSTVLTGVFLYASTTALTSDALLGWDCAYNFTSNIMYAVLYAYTPEIFVTKDRGTGNAMTATANRVFGIMAASGFSYSSRHTLTMLKAHHCNVREPGDLCSGIYEWGTVSRCRYTGCVTALRTTGQGQLVVCVDGTMSLVYSVPIAT